MGNGRAGYRVARGWSQERLAEESGLTRAIVRGVESGNPNVRLSVLHRCADTLGVDRAEYADPQLVAAEPTPAATGTGS